VPATAFWEKPPRGSRLALLVRTGSEMAGVERWSRRMVPEELPPEHLANRLSSVLKQFRYTLDNPSGRAENPMEDFLERSHAGHCEYFASALATMLRRRGVPARVVNGYRLGPWIAEGGYWLVTQDEAHSWVEYFDPAASGWRVADPTPAAPPSNLQLGTLMAALQRWMDAARYRWDRHVVRFSGQDQMEGLDWIREQATQFSTWRPTHRNLVLGMMMLLSILLFASRTRLKSLTRRSVLSGGVQALKPLLRATQKFAPPTAGETARAWLMRLVTLRPERGARLRELAEEVDAETYGARLRGRAAKLAKEESRLWGRGSKSMNPIGQIPDQGGNQKTEHTT
jgi:protein-glutamine gamma-glutamyltransferase